MDPKQRAFLRKELGPALLRAAPLWVGLGFRLHAKIAALPPQDAPKLEPFSFGLALQLVFPLTAIGSEIRRAVLDCADPEHIHARVTAQVVEILEVLLQDKTETGVTQMVSFVSAEVDRVFSESGLWGVLNRVDDVFGG